MAERRSAEGHLAPGEPHAAKSDQRSAASGQPSGKPPYTRPMSSEFRQVRDERLRLLTEGHTCNVGSGRRRAAARGAR